MTTTTTLVHRAYSGPLEWWREALVYEIPSPDLDGGGLRGLVDVLDHVLWLGFSTVLVRPSRLELPREIDALQDFTCQAHERGLRVVGRVSGALGPVTGAQARSDERYVTGAERDGDGLLARAEAFLAAGADGVDFGTIIPPELTEQTDLGRLTEYVAVLQGLVASYVDDGMVGADVSGHYPESLRHHLEEDWLHHLRDDSLVLARWEVDSLTRHLTRSLGEHDRFGAAPVWRHLPGCALAPETDPGDGRQWFNASPEELRLRTAALQTLALALPGSVYLRQGDEIGLPDDQRSAGPAELAGIVAEQSPLQSQRLGSSLANVRHAVRLRRERRLAAAPLAFVTGMDWSRPDVFTLLVRDVLVVVNTAHHPVALPERTEVLLSSQMLGRAENRLVVPPTTTVWLDAATAA